MGNQSGTLGVDDPALVNVEGRKASNSLSLPPHLRPGLHSPREMIAQVNAAHADMKESPRTPNADDNSARGLPATKELDQLKTFMELKYKRDSATEMIGAVAGGEAGHPIRKHFAKRLNFYKELELVVGSNARRRSTLVAHIRPDPEAAAKDDDDNNDSHSTTIPPHMQEALANASPGASIDSTTSSKGLPTLEHQNSRSISLIDENGESLTDGETDLETDNEADQGIAPSRSVSTGSDGGLHVDGDLIRNNTVVIDDRKTDLALEEKRKLKRLRVLGEIVDSEKLYYKFLVILCDKFHKPMSTFLSADQMSSIFSNITAMAPLHEIFAKELAAAPNVITVFSKYCNYLKIYTPYVNNYEKALATLSQLRNHKKYQEFTQKCRKDESIGGLDLTSFLIMPIQRIPRYRLLLEQLKKYTPDEDPESPALQDILGRISSIAEQVNESKRQLEHMTTILAVQERISGDTQLFAPHRQLIREAALIRKKNSSKPIHMFLFNDIMLWTSPSPGYKFKGLIKLCTCTVKEYVHKNKIGFSVVNPAMPQDLTLVFATEAERDQWRKLILENIESAKLLNDNKRSRLHQRRNDMHNKIQSQLKNLSGTLKKRLMDKGFLAAAAAGDEAAVNAAIEAAEKAEADGTAQGVFGRVAPRGQKPPLAQAHTGGSESSLTDDASLVDYQEEHSITLDGDSDEENGVHTLARSDTSRRPGKAGHGGHSGSDTDEDDPAERERRLAQVRKEVKEQRDTPPPMPATPQAAHHPATTLAAAATPAPAEAKADAATPPAPVPVAASAGPAAAPEPSTPPSASSTGSGPSATHKRQTSAGAAAEKKTTAASKPPISRIPSSAKSPPVVSRQSSKPQSPRVASAAGAGLSRTASRLGSAKPAAAAAPAESAAAPAAKAAAKAPPLPPRPGSKSSLPTKPPAVAPKPAPKPASAAPKPAKK